MTSAPSQPKIVVFTSRLSYSVRRGLIEIDRAVPGASWLVLASSPRRSMAELMKSQWRNLRRNGWRWIPYQAADLLARAFARAETDDARAPGADSSMAALESRPRFRIVWCADLHSTETVAEVTAFGPDLGVSLAAPILRKTLFSIPRLGTLNLHKGKLPDYRGMPPAFWELWNGEKAVGCTVHCVDDGLDTGGVVAHKIVERAPYSTLRGLQLQLDEVGVQLMADAVRDVLGNRATLSPQTSGGRTYRKPTLKQVAALQSKLREPSPERFGAKELLKYSAGKVAFPLWSLCARHALARRITVLLYHRVSDDARDNLTVGIEQFDRQMEFVRSKCEPLSIDDVIAHDSVIPSSRKPLVCVTFDDGYLDNYVNAAPILLRHRVPAAFFVSTRIVGTHGRFPHDVKRNNPLIPVMQWDDLREMRRQGFTIGSHSMTHIDCAAEGAETVWQELVGSLSDLRRELELEDVLFAYPYGGRQHMTAERLELVKKAGYAACLSAYGGTNLGRVDRWNVVRRGIHWQFSHKAFALECLGLT
jgi:peptidoglycan/xylan/chitin deacetylase (PgdA/CDA1 family)